jgi:hypothetical protein
MAKCELNAQPISHFLFVTFGLFNKNAFSFTALPFGGARKTLLEAEEEETEGIRRFPGDCAEVRGRKFRVFDG